MHRRNLGREKAAIAGLTALLAAVFWGPAIQRTGGAFPAPLDDVYIHFDYARALAEGSPFAWISGQGYSSGETAPLYAWVLAAGYLVGFRGAALGWFAGVVSLASVYSGLGAAARLLRGLSLLPRVLGLASLASASVTPFLLFSGMEGALHFACMMHALAAYDSLVGRAPARAPVASRPSRLRRLALLSVAMFLLRPESVVLTWLLSVGVGRAQRGPRALPAVLSVALPTALVLGLFAAMNWAFTGFPEAAGAKLKLLSSNPYLTNVDRARELALNLFHFAQRALGVSLSAWRSAAAALLALALIALLGKRTRGTAAVGLLGALAFAGLVSLNGAARYQNFRYYVPALSLLVLSALLGAARLSASRWLRVPVALGLACFALAAAPRVWEQSVYFARCAANIAGQQVVVGTRLARELPADAIVLVGDAGAIPYVSRRHAIDAIGLGGYHGVPFVLAATQGEAATLELLESLPERERPTHLALFPNWFPETTRRFGVPLFSVTIADNAIGGGPVKAVYRADWSAFAREGEARSPVAKDELDVADVVSERAHRYVHPAPRGGWTTLDVRDDGVHFARFDGGRVIPPGEAESFALRASGQVTLVARWDVDGTSEADAPALEVGGRMLRAPLPRARAGAFTDVRVPLGELPEGARVTVRAGAATLRSYHYWVE